MTLTPWKWIKNMWGRENNRSEVGRELWDTFREQ
jgi:hypothetical protein